MGSVTMIVDNERAMGLLITAWMNPQLTDKQLSDSLQRRGALAIKAQWEAKGITVSDPIAAALSIAEQTWNSMSESERVVWMGRLIQATSIE